MRTVYTLIFLLLTGAAYGQSKLPACPDIVRAYRHYCFGSRTFPNGDKYVGEYKDDKVNGRGTALYANGNKYVGEFKDNKYHGQGTFFWANGNKYVGEYKDDKRNGQGTFFWTDGRIDLGEWKEGQRHGRFIEYKADKSVERSGIYENGLLVTSQYIDPNSFTRIAKNPFSPPPSNIASAETEAQLEQERRQRQEIERRAAQLEEDRQRLAQERAKLDAEKAQREQARQASRIAIDGTFTQPDANGEFTVSIQTHADTSSLKVNGEEIGGRADGKYTIKRFARVGQETTLTLVARDMYGNTDTKTLVVNRPFEAVAEFMAPLNVTKLRIQPPRDAVAIIIGIQDYKRVPKAEFASEDARAFYDYARRGLGIKPENIKMLLDTDADDVEIVKAFSNWLPFKVNKDRTEVYVFFSGHGMPSADGKLYLLPHGVDKDLLSRTAIAQKELVTALQDARPKSVTMFIDSCYSGQARGGEQLVASARPVSIMVSERSYPDNFTVMSASANSQISSSSPDLKHGIFSYYLMKGMEGDADQDGDGKITVGELQAFLADKVPRYAMKTNRKQDPQMVGDANRVLVAR